MKPKEKAEELILKFMRLQEPNYNWFHSKLAKQCALIAVDEMINDCDASSPFETTRFEFWQQVKTEINNL